MIKKIHVYLSNPKILVFTMLWMMVLVVLGTLAQKDYGLYESQRWFFSAWISWIGFIPTPGGRLTLLVMFINIFCFILKKSFWSFKKIGIITTHLGVLLLLIGGGLTAWFSSEGVMVIKEGESSNFISDHYYKELVIISRDSDGQENMTTINEALFKENKIIQSESFPFSIKINKYFTNSVLIRREEPVGSDYKGLAKNFILSGIPNDKEISLNQAGIAFEVSGAGEDSDGFYSLILEQTIPQKIRMDDKIFTLILQRKKTYLPFEIELIDFKKVLHPGTDIAKSYSSDINLNEGDISRRVLIKMNQPLRHYNFTFYQSSFIEGFDKDTTVLAVVKNYGRLFPYIASLIMAIGLLMHMILKLPMVFKRKSR